MTHDGLAVLQVGQLTLLHLVDGAAVVLVERLRERGGLLRVLGVVAHLAEQQRHGSFECRGHLARGHAELLAELGGLVLVEADHVEKIHPVSRNGHRAERFSGS